MKLKTVEDIQKLDVAELGLEGLLEIAEQNPDFNYSYAACELLTITAYENYRKIQAAAWEEYRKIQAAALAEYYKIEAPAYAEYEKSKAAARAEYEKTQAAAFMTAYYNQEAGK